jgi:hypothetical protein
MGARDKGSVDDEVGAGGASDRPHAARHDAEGLLRLAVGDGSQNPHRDL